MKLHRNLLFTPGPATTTDSVKQAQVIPDICPREAEFTRIIRDVQKRLLQVAGATSETHSCILIGGSGTAAVEAALTSCVPQGAAVAVVVNGAYGQRIVDILTAHAIKVVPIPAPLVHPLDPELIREALARHHGVRALAMVHHETSTGLVNPVRAAGLIAQEAGCTFVVDAISSLGGMPLNVAEDRVDLLVSTGNKCLQGLPGLSFVIARTSLLDAMRSHPQRSYYLNLIDQHDEFCRSGQFRFTAPVNTIYALRQALVEWEQEGGAQRIARYQALSRRLRDGLRRQGFKLLLEDAWTAPVMTSVQEPDDPAWNFHRVHDALLARGITIYPGKVPGQGTFRVATLGDLHADDVDRLLSKLGEIYQPGRPS